MRPRIGSWSRLGLASSLRSLVRAWPRGACVTPNAPRTGATSFNASLARPRR